MSSTSKVLAAFLCGAVAGAITGILFAPDRGSETRRKISDSTKDIVDKAKKSATKVADVFNKAKSNGEEIFS